MARLLFAGAAAPLLFLFSCARPVAEAPPEAEPAPVEPVAVVDSPIAPTVRPQDLPIPAPPTEEEIAAVRATIVRLTAADFPELPAPIATLLDERGCTIPQVSYPREKGNLIRGEFFAGGEPGWAVICSRDNRFQILVFRSDRDADPVVLSEGDDAICWPHATGCSGYQLAIHTVGRDFILDHYRAYGGQEPPPIDHHGIDVAAVEKASAVRYFHDGQWLMLQGAD